MVSLNNPTLLSLLASKISHEKDFVFPVYTQRHSPGHGSGLFPKIVALRENYHNCPDHRNSPRCRSRNSTRNTADVLKSVGAKISPIRSGWRFKGKHIYPALLMPTPILNLRQVKQHWSVPSYELFAVFTERSHTLSKRPPIILNTMRKLLEVCVNKDLALCTAF